jgi:hypothetical protein
VLADSWPARVWGSPCRRHPQRRSFDKNNRIPKSFCLKRTVRSAKPRTWFKQKSELAPAITHSLNYCGSLPTGRQAAVGFPHPRFCQWALALFPKHPVVSSDIMLIGRLFSKMHQAEDVCVRFPNCRASKRS